jgi:hypothetical protein
MKLVLNAHGSSACGSNVMNRFQTLIETLNMRRCMKGTIEDLVAAGVPDQSVVGPGRSYSKSLCISFANAGVLDRPMF